MSRPNPRTRSFFRGYPARMLVTMSLGWALLQAGRFVFSPLLPRIVSDLSVTEATAGFALTLLQLVYAAIQYPSGIWSDRLGRVTILVPAFLLLIFGFFIVGLAASFALLLVGTIVVGAGKGLYASPSRALLFDEFSAMRGRAIGLFAAGTDVGGLLGAGLGVLVLEVAVWRVAFFPIGIALIGVLLGYLCWNREPVRRGRPSLDIVATVSRIGATVGLRRILLAYGLFYFMVSGFITFFPLFLTSTKHYSESLASGIFAVVFVVGLLIKPFAGYLSDRSSPFHIGALGLVVAGIGLLALQFVQSLVPVVAVVVLTALGYKTQFPLADTIVMESVPQESIGGDLGAARAVFLGAGSLGPVVVGTAVTTVGYRVAFVGLALCLFISAAVLFSVEG